MERTTKLFSVFVLCVAAMAHQAAAQENLKGKDLINKVCKKSPTKNLCIQVLSSDPLTSPDADLRGLAVIALRVAAKNASSILTEAKTLINDDHLDPDVQQGLADCKVNILDAESQLEDTIAALLVDFHDSDIQAWLTAALAAIDTCDASIPGDDDILSVQSAVFRKLCNIAISVISLLNNPSNNCPSNNPLHNTINIPIKIPNIRNPLKLV
ncbi:unnamed protein product [Sphenostylis stenocarpa]|uniref:Pectinesterase inhibitor domain-containing protein n=1 Tax=Sphenostylis stenocarpa TaxID=92480 RepID=A0AA86RX31_9FABA|nr:unnamed protein product [Sphenostylis stenocarpa]